jgi:hypothetical protein
MGALRAVNCGRARRPEEFPGATLETCFLLRLGIRGALVLMNLAHFLNADVLRLAFSSPFSRG